MIRLGCYKTNTDNFKTTNTRLETNTTRIISISAVMAAFIAIREAKGTLRLKRSAPFGKGSVTFERLTKVNVFG